MEDRRIQKSKNAIRQSFLGLLQEKSLNQITVSEICRIANIGRGTFYLHYTDIYDLYDQIENHLYEGLYQLFESCYPTTDVENSRRLTEGLTTYVALHKDIFLLLVRSDNGHSLQKLRTAFHEKALLENRRLHPAGNIEYDAVEAVFAVSGIVGVLEEWLNGGMQIPKDTIAEMLNHILGKINAECETEPMMGSKLS